VITIKLPIQTNITQYLKQYNNIVRFAYNRYQEGNDYKQSDIEHIVKRKMNNIALMDASFIKAAVDKAKHLKDKPKVIFGSKKNWQRYNKG